MIYRTIREEPYAGATLRLANFKAGEYRGILLKRVAASSARSAETSPTKPGLA